MMLSPASTPDSISSRKPVVALLVACLLGLSGFVSALVNEAISLAYEAATPYIEEGFEIREDNWSGESEPEKPLLIRHQLFRGNEYWFWGGTSWPGASIVVDIFDADGNSIGLESFSDDYNAGVRALPQKTGTYFIRVTTAYDPESLTEEEKSYKPAVGDTGEFPGVVDWGVVYGYR